MGWDASRPVPWQRMVREWLVYVAIMAALFLLFFRGANMIGIFAGLLASGPIYLAFGYALAKFGYRRKTLSELRSESAGRGRDRDRGDGRGDDTDQPRPKPAPTRRTGGGSGRPGGPRRKR
jgi:hypothetical protein